MPKYTSDYTGAQIDAAIKAVIDTKLGTYDGVCQVIKITSDTTTLGDILTELIAVNTAGNYVFFDTSALNANAYMCTISFDDFSNPSTYKITELVTSQIGNGFYGENVTLLSCLLNLVPIGDDTTVYGVRWDKTTTQLTRYGKGAGITTTTTNFKYSGSVNENYDNPFDFIYPWSGRKLCNINLASYMALQEGDSLTDCVSAWEGDSGFSYNDPMGVWVYTPEFWASVHDDGTYRYFEVSANEKTGYVHFDESIQGKWQGGNVKSITIGGTAKACLIPGVGVPLGNTALSSLHTYAKNYGATLMNRWTYDANAILYLVEFASYDVQTTLGNGVSDLYDDAASNTVASVAGDVITMSAVTATDYVENAILHIGTEDFIIREVDSLDITVDHEPVSVTEGDRAYIYGMANYDDEMGSKSGYIGTNGKSHAYYRGLEFYANMFTYILGIYRDGATNHVWVAADPAEADNYDALDKAVHTDTGIVLADTTGYVKKLGISTANNLFCTPCCTEIGGGAAPCGYDYHYVDSTTGARLLVAGGYANSGSRCGFFGGWHAYSGYAYWICAARPNLLIP